MSNNQGNAAAQPATSAELRHLPQRRWERIQKCKPYVAEFLASTPATAGLTNAQKDEVLKEVKSQLYDNVTTFMDLNPPRSIYPMKEAVRAILKTIFHWNNPKYGVQWVAGMFDDNPQAPGAAAAQAARDGSGNDA
ncbi:hypothetical protein PG985_011801 [Apiospora marii]|uniref:Uncharacterized protein n=1 Tax=Apiospora marii TaxID=335849 RepID=A0ABR1QZZ9_9PEZI